MFKTIILSIIIPLLELLTFNYTYHINLLDKVFNTKIFHLPNKTPYLIGITIALILYTIKNTKLTKKTFKHTYKYLFLIPTILLPIINIKLSIILIPIILFLINKNNHTKETLSIKNIISINIINLLTLINIPIFISTLLACKINKISKKESLKISIFLMILNNLKYIVNLTIDNYTIISIILSTIVSTYFINKLINIYNQNKLHKISIILILIILFKLYWFR